MPSRKWGATRPTENGERKTENRARGKRATNKSMALYYTSTVAPMGRSCIS